MIDFKDEVQQQLASAATRFGLRIQPVDQHEVLLRGERFSLSITCDRDGLDINYIDQTEPSLRSYRLSNYLHTQKFTQTDRALFGQPSTPSDRIVASLRVVASGLENRCADLLSGDRTWLAILKRKDADAWRGDSTPPRIAKALESS